MSKHFNAGNVWGTIKSLEVKQNQKKVKFLLVELDCSGNYGAVRAFGRLFGQEKIDALIEHHRANPGVMVRFRGYVGQYEKSDAVRTNFTFYNWAIAPDQPARAAFVLVGEVVEVVDDGHLLRLALHLTRKGQAGYGDQEEEFDLWTYEAKLVGMMQPGQIVEVKGCMQQGQGEDEFGGSTGDVLPIIMKSKVVEGF